MSEIAIPDQRKFRHMLVSWAVLVTAWAQRPSSPERDVRVRSCLYRCNMSSQVNRRDVWESELDLHCLHSASTLKMPMGQMYLSGSPCVLEFWFFKIKPQNPNTKYFLRIKSYQDIVPQRTDPLLDHPFTLLSPDTFVLREFNKLYKVTFRISIQAIVIHYNA